MNVLESHTIEHLNSFINRASDGFDLIYDRLTNSDKEYFKDFLKYVDNIVNEAESKESSDLKYTHIHFPNTEFDTTILLEFLLVKFYLKSAINNSISEGDSYIDHHLEKIKMELEHPMYLSEKAPKREVDKKRGRRIGLRKLKKSFVGLQALGISPDISNFHPKCLINVLTKDKNYLINSPYPALPYFMTLEDQGSDDLLKPRSYVLINDNQTLDQLDETEFPNGAYLTDTLEDVILFDCDSKTSNRKSSFSDLKELNNEGSRFKNLVVFSFDKKNLRLGRLIPQLNTISTRYFLRPSSLDFETYSCLPYEVNSLLNRTEKARVIPNFIGQQSFIWQDFQQYVYEFEELSELISIKMRNVYALCFSDVYKDFVLNDLFSSSCNESTLLTTTTKSHLSDLNQQVLKELKTRLDAVLQLVLELGNSNIIQSKRKHGKYNIILPYKVLNNKILRQQTQAQFKHLGDTNFTTWRDIDTGCTGQVLILDYRDSGRFPYSISPSLFEHSFPQAKSIEAPLIAALFKYNYDYTFFDYHLTLYQKILKHPIREKHFQWNQLTKTLYDLRPTKSESEYLWDLDNIYSNFGERETITIKYTTGTKRSYYPSQLLIGEEAYHNQLFSIRAGDLPDQINNQIISIQPIDELYAGLNLFKTTREEEQEIDQLKKNYNLPAGEKENRLWKIQLKRKVDESNAKEVYAELKEYLELQKLTIVSESYFLDQWVVSHSKMLIPRSKRVFKAVCDFLKLPPVYFRVLLKKRANERLASRQSTSKMNRLIAELIDLGMFHEELPKISFDDSFLEKHDLEEVGFNEENLNNEVKTLVDLLKPSLNLLPVEHAKLKTS